MLTFTQLEDRIRCDNSKNDDLYQLCISILTTLTIIMIMLGASLS